MDQNDVFRRAERNAWYARNRGHLRALGDVADAPDVSFVVSTLAPFGDRIGRVFEMGCSSGLKLETICGRVSAEGEDIEPSQVAVDEGNLRPKNVSIRLQSGSRDQLRFEADSFDIVYLAFCLYLFDRSSLMPAFAEADRVPAPGGFLAVTNFDPGTRQKRPYSHAEGLYSYKQDHGSISSQSGPYYLVGKNNYSYRQPFFDKDPDERVSTSILLKERDAYPAGS